MKRIIVNSEVKKNDVICKVNIKGELTPEEYRMIVMEIMFNLLDIYYRKCKGIKIIKRGAPD